MKDRIQQFLGIGTLLLAIGAASLGAREPASTDSKTVPVTLSQFPTAETHLMMKSYVDSVDCLGVWWHARGFVSIDEQKVVRMNRDTLYSSLPNFLPTMPGWNYMLRLYFPEAPYFEGSLEGFRGTASSMKFDLN